MENSGNDIGLLSPVKPPRKVRLAGVAAGSHRVRTLRQGREFRVWNGGAYSVPDMGWQGGKSNSRGGTTRGCAPP
jgi:hypothetical protein